MAIVRLTKCSIDSMVLLLMLVLHMMVLSICGFHLSAPSPTIGSSDPCIPRSDECETLRDVDVSENNFGAGGTEQVHFDVGHDKGKGSDSG